MSADPQNAPHPGQLDKNAAERPKRQAPRAFRRTRRRFRQTAPENPDIVHHIGGMQFHEDTWSPAPAITEASGHAELLRGINNLHSFMRAIAAENPDRAKALAREYGRAAAMVLGAASLRLGGACGNLFQASQESIRNWDILKVPRTPAPGLRLDGVRSAPIFDLHAVLDTGALQASLMALHFADGTLDQRIARLI